MTINSNYRPEFISTNCYPNTNYCPSRVLHHLDIILFISCHEFSPLGICGFSLTKLHSSEKMVLFHPAKLRYCCANASLCCLCWAVTLSFLAAVKYLIPLSLSLFLIVCEANSNPELLRISTAVLNWF